MCNKHLSLTAKTWKREKTNGLKFFDGAILQ